MTSYDQIKALRLTTDANTNKNISSETLQFSSASVVVGAGSFVTRTYTIPLSAETRFYQIYINYSFRAGEYYSTAQFDYVDPVVLTRRYAVQVSSNTSGSVTMTIYLVNNDVSSTTFAAFDINVLRRDFLDEIT